MPFTRSTARRRPVFRGRQLQRTGPSQLMSCPSAREEHLRVLHDHCERIRVRQSLPTKFVWRGLECIEVVANHAPDERFILRLAVKHVQERRLLPESPLRRDDEEDVSFGIGELLG